ncbi:hypothetical protein BT63DRAFT_422460 [Microthyrium microscopicum]|uniref:Uncharacterized protein n=1 Tax=Microthyrium microscopicum TaxID=703497 RepID=A0A6A6UJR0_9PEZI|nr:hypothetical protein BT63DRAFT_422460 [Microthyrium microscopicum]
MAENDYQSHATSPHSLCNRPNNADIGLVMTLGSLVYIVMGGLCSKYCFAICRCSWTRSGKGPAKEQQEDRDNSLSLRGLWEITLQEILLAPKLLISV